jgi:predicted alpha-1,2-mannosidase
LLKHETEDVMIVEKLRATSIGALFVAMLSLGACGGNSDDTGPTSNSGGVAPSPAPITAAGLTHYVNPLIGTAPGNSPNPVGHGAGGNVLPAAGLPSGMVQWGPDTNTTPAPNTTRESGSPAGYYYDINTIAGFSLTHMSGTGGSGNDGEFPILPAVGPSVTTPTFSHANETAAPGYYSVTLDNNVKVELTATLRTGFGRFTYPAGAPALLVLDTTRTNTRTNLVGSVAVVASDTIEGSTVGGGFEGNGTLVPVFFYAQFDQPFLASSSIDHGVATLAFNPGAAVQMKIGISYVSIANAKLNLQTENPGWNFAGVQQAANTSWEQRLDTIRVTGGTPAAMTKFYTAFYHVLWAPSTFSDVNGQYLGFDMGVHTVGPGQTAQYSGFSGWDIYRSLFPLKAFLFSSETSDMAQSLINDADQCGAIPHWVNDNYEAGVMPGDAGSLMVAGAYAFGAQNFDTVGALSHMIKMANIFGAACNGTATNGGRQNYLKFGYITSGDSGIASSTLEYTSSDFAISQFAGALGNTTMQQIIGSRTAYWQNELNTALTPPLIVGRGTNGVFDVETPTSTDNYEQGSAEQYTWMVPYNVGGLITQLGGTAAVQTRLDSFMTQLNAGTGAANLYIGNEPSFAIPWYYDWAGIPSSTQSLIQRILNTSFDTTPGGLPGNDDMGATSSWYMWASLGLYPGIPGVGGFVISSPQFSSITIQLQNGKTVQINAPGAPASNFISGLSVNGQAQTSTWVPVSALLNGGTMNFAMSSSPSSWGTGPNDAPPSFAIPVAASINDAFNNRSASLTGTTNTDGKGSDFDGELNTYAADQFASQGAIPGQPFTADGATFNWGNPAGLDNAVTVGQTIMMASGPTDTTLVVLGAANNGPSSGLMTLTYADGTTSTATLTFLDWTNGGNTGVPAAIVALTSAHRNNSSGAADTTKAYVYAVEIPLVPGKTLASVTLPRLVQASSSGKIHVFGLAVK